MHAMALALLLCASVAGAAAQSAATERSGDARAHRVSLAAALKTDMREVGEARSFRYERSLTDRFERERAAGGAAEQEPGAERTFRRRSVRRRRADWKAFIPLSAAVYTMGLLDQTATVGHRYWRINEEDPLIKPLTQVPAPVFVAGGGALETGVNWLAWRMGRSRRWHRVWWLPQICAVGANAYGYDVSTHY